MTVETGVNFNLNAEDNTKKAFRSLQNSLRNTSRTLQVVQGPLGPIAGRFTALSGIMGTVSIKALAVTAAFTGTALVLKKSISAFAAFETRVLQLEAQLKSTGATSGQTAASLESMAQRIARSTLASTAGVREAQAVLLSFRSVGPDTFERTLVAAQDLADAGIGELRTNVLQLGKALEDPIKGLNSLRRSGVDLGDAMERQIEILVLSGDKWAAQKLILEGIENQVSGSGVGAAGGLTGAFDSLTQSIDNMFTEMGRSATEGGAFKRFISTLSEGAQRAADFFSTPATMNDEALARSVLRQRIKIAGLETDIKNKGDGGYFSNRKEELNDQREILRGLQIEVSIRAELATGSRNMARLENTKREAADAASRAFEAAEIQRKKDDKEINRLMKKYEKAADPVLAAQKEIEQAMDLIIKKYGEGSDEVVRFAENAAIALEKIQDRVDRQAAAALKRLGDAAGDTAEDIAETIGDAFLDMVLQAKTATEAISGMLMEIGRQLAQFAIIDPLVQSLGGLIKPVLSSIPAFAAGGVSPGGTILVGEQGPELLSPPRGSRITPLNGSMGGSSTVVQIINNTPIEPEVSEQRQPNGDNLIRVLLNAVASDITNNGQVGRAMDVSRGTRTKRMNR